MKDSLPTKARSINYEGLLIILRSDGSMEWLIDAPERDFTAQNMVEVAQLALRSFAPEPPPSVRIPTSEDEAALMVLLGTQWLKDNAPQRLRQPDEPPGGAVPKTEWEDLLEAAKHLARNVEQVGHIDYGPACHICQAIATVDRLSETKEGSL